MQHLSGSQPPPDAFVYFCEGKATIFTKAVHNIIDEAIPVKAPPKDTTSVPATATCAKTCAKLTHVPKVIQPPSHYRPRVVPPPTKAPKHVGIRVEIDEVGVPQMVKPPKLAKTRSGQTGATPKTVLPRSVVVPKVVPPPKRAKTEDVKGEEVKGEISIQDEIRKMSPQELNNLKRLCWPTLQRRRPRSWNMKKTKRSL